MASRCPTLRIALFGLSRMAIGCCSRLCILAAVKQLRRFISLTFPGCMMETVMLRRKFGKHMHRKKLRRVEDR